MKWLKGIGALLALGVIGAAIMTWDPLSNPSSAKLAEAAANYEAEIIRDNWGTPHIYGKRDPDVAFGIAYAHAEDDYETIQGAVAATRGVLARYNGKDAATTDYLVTFFDVWDTVEDGYDTKLSDELKAYAEGYAAGLNLYASEHPDETWAGLAPFEAKDLIAGGVFRTPFFYGLDETLLKLFGNEHEQQIALDPSAGRKAWHAVPLGAPERGSNAAAIAPTRSGDGATRLLINSHQPMTGPVAWWEAHLVSEEGLDISGGTFPGSSMILHGFNRHLGWANTVSKPDLADVFVLERNPDNKMQYKLDGEWTDFEVDTARINVKLFGPFAVKAKRKVLRSVHGPVIVADHGTYAIRYAGIGEVRQLEQYYRFNRARSLDEFMDAMALNALPSINYIYADKDGNVAFIHNGQYPARDDGWDWSAEMPGDRSDIIWQGYRPIEAMPVLINPESGAVFNANNTPYSATDGTDNLSAADFPQSMGLQTNETNRSLRLMELLKASELVDAARLEEIKFDTIYSDASVAADLVKTVLAEDWSSDPALAAAAEHLSAWTFETEPDSRHAALGALTVMPQITEEFTKIPAPSPQDAFRAAVAYLTTHHGGIDPEWGEVNRLVRGELSLPIGGAPDVLRAIYPAELRDDGILPSAAGDTWIAIVEWDDAGEQSAKVIHQYGAATLDEASPHYADQAAMFAAREWRPALLSRADVEAKAERTYTVGGAN